MTNQNYCPSDLPMTRLGNEETNAGSAVRFWTLMWDIRHHYGDIDRDLALTAALLDEGWRVCAGQYMPDWPALAHFLAAPADPAAEDRLVMADWQGEEWPW